MSAGFPTFAPGEDRKLLAGIHRWARTNGWSWAGAWGWVNAPNASDATLAVEWNSDSGALTVQRGEVLLRPTWYDVDSVREAVDFLVALGILPASFARAYEAGWHDGYFHDVEGETKAEIKASWAKPGGTR